MSTLFQALHLSTNWLSFGVFLGSLLGFLVLRVLWPSSLQSLCNGIGSKKFWLPLSLAFLVAFLVFLGCCTVYKGYLDHVETNVAAVSAAFNHGAPLYHDLVSAQRYSLVYGPICYLPFSLALYLFGSRLLSLKLVVLFANLSFLTLLWAAYRKRLDASHVFLAVAAVVAFMMSGEPYMFQVRGDALMPLTVALAMFGVLSPSRWTSVLLLSLATGLCFGIKVTGVLYFLPLFVLCYRQHGIRTVALAALGAALVGSLPFAIPQVSLTNYLLWFHEASRHPLRAVEFLSNLRTSVTISLPVLLLVWRFYESDARNCLTYLRDQKLFLLSLAGSLGMMTILASKFGAGNHHLLPFYPVIGLLCSDLYSRIQAAGGVRRMAYGSIARAVCWLWLASTIATRIPVEFLATERKLAARWSLAAAATQDLTAIIQAHPGERIEMGYSHSYPLTSFRPTLVFAGNPLTLDAPALDDMQLAGLVIPQATIDYIKSCKTNIWLIPKGEAPFVIPNIYEDPKVFPRRNLFEDRFRQAFLLQYQRVGSSDYFDLWACREESPRQ
jgi:hypothetical protein